MDIETLTTIALFINAGALVFIGWQTILTRQSVKLSEKTIQEATRIKELADLPKANLVINARLMIERWKTDLQKLIDDEEYIKAQIKANDTTLGTRYGLKSPTGIIDKYIYKTSPDWLQVILTTAAQYYYDCKAAASCLSPGETPEVSLSLLHEICERAKVGIHRMTELLSYIDKMVPEWYLYCPASLNDSEFINK
jgi:hypothetical protein